jgi:hypothetical protein
MNLTEKLALYMTQSLSNRLGVASTSSATYRLSYDVLKDCEMMVAQVHRAYTNPSRLLIVCMCEDELKLMPN